MFQDDTLKDRHILVTGGGSGLGLAMATYFHQLGAHVALCGRRPQPLQEAADAIGERAVAIPCDVRDPEQVRAMFDELTRRWGVVDGLVNNAAGNFCPRRKT